MTSSKNLQGFLASSFLGAALALQGCAGVAVKPAEPDIKTGMTNSEQTHLFQIMMELIRQAYVDPSRGSDNERLIGKALKGAVRALDPHSDYLTPDEYAEMKEDESGLYSGIGIETIIGKDGRLRIIAPFKNTPAERAGIQSDDVITQIDGRNIAGMPLKETSGLLTGQPQTPVTLTILRPGSDQPVNMTITRDIVKTQSVKVAAIGTDIAYIKIDTFDKKGLTDEFRDAVASLKKQMGGHPAGYVVDVRGNTGGFLGEVLDIADDMIDGTNTILSVRGREEKDAYTYEASAGDLTEGKPMILLVDGGSASASEILAGALQDNHRAAILGTQTYGKGSVQKVFPVDTFVPGQQGAIKLTVRLYFTPSGRSIQGLGISPDILFVPPDGVKLPEYRRESELANTIAHPDDKKDETRTSQTCKAVQTALPVGTQLAKPMVDLKGSPDYAVICAVETLRKMPDLTVTQPYVAPAPALVAR